MKRSTTSKRESSPSDAGAAAPTVAPVPLLDPVRQDQLLDKTGSDSIYQRARLLNSKQRIVLDLLLSGIDGPEACRRAGYKTSTPLRSMQNKIADLMDRQELTDIILIEKLAVLLNAKETKFFQHNGKVKDKREVDALDIQLRTLDLATKFKGWQRTTENEQGQMGDINVTIVQVG